MNLYDEKGMALIQSLKNNIRGEVITKDHPSYEETRRIHNRMPDKRPALIVCCKDPADVMECVNSARENKILLAVRGGGHNGAGLGSCDDGLVIDLSRMRGVRVDPIAKTVRAEGGCLLGDIDHATHAFGLALPMGINSTTGIGGLALGGGMGYLSRQYGLTIDNLLEADIVLADGRLLVVSANQHADLFWAIRGGGGNFGVVTSFLFKVHPVKIVYGGPMFFELDQTKEIMKWYEGFIKTAADNIYAFLGLNMVPPGDPFPAHLHLKRMCILVWCYTGPMEDAEKIFNPIRAFKKPALDMVGSIPMPSLQSLFDPILGPGNWYWKGDFVNELSEEAIDLHIRHAANIPNITAGMHLYPINGAASRKGKKDTPWNYRDSIWSMVIATGDSLPSDMERNITWAKEYWKVIHPYTAGGSYVNFMMEEGDDRIKATYGENYSALVKVKTIYDPENLFRVNQNIKPISITPPNLQP